MTLRQLLESGMAAHQAGNLPEAEKCYREALKLNPSQPDALHLAGALAGQAGRLDEGIELIKRAIAIYPAQVIYHCNLAELYRQAGNASAAIAAAREAIRVDPKSARAFCNMGLALALDRKTEDAVAAFRRALDIDPKFADGLNHLGTTLNSLGQYDDAMQVFRRLLQLRPDSVDGLVGLGVALRENGRPVEAIEIFQRAIRIQPDSFAAHNALGVALGLAEQVDDAIAEFKRAIQIDPASGIAMKNLGVALSQNGSFEESQAALEKAVDLKPDLPEAHGNLAMVLLTRGQFDRGWTEYEWRWRANLTFLSPPRDFSQPRWDGKPLDGKTILLHAEQGFGDTMQFVRYLPRVAAMGGRVVLEVQPDLVRLIHRMPGAQRIFATGDVLPRFDCHCPLLSLPLAFSTDLISIPAEIPYLSPDPALTEKWKTRLDSTGHSFKVGFVWAGNPKNKLDSRRSVPFDSFAKLLTNHDVRFFSLQKNAGKIAWPTDSNVTDWTGELRDFDDTASLIANLDLVISVDTAVAHLAGAMGRPIWLMIPFMPDWRWMLDRTDSPWYPTMRIFRQSARGDWADVIERVSAALREKAAEHNA